MERIIGIGEYEIDDNKQDRIITFALSSCIAVSVYSPDKKAAGMIHSALPTPINKSDCLVRPCYFVTTGIPIMLHAIQKQFSCSLYELEVGLYGGADSINQDDIFQIGKRNIGAAIRTLESLHLEIDFMEVGGTLSRTLEMNVGTGEVTILTQPITI